MKPLQIIIAVDETGGFAKEGKIPWYYSEDLKHFQTITKNSACIMGRKTYQDMYDMIISRKSKNKNTKNKNLTTKEILPGRDSYVISNTLKNAIGATIVKNMRKAILSTERNNIFVIGGERVFLEALPWVEKIYLTLVKGVFDCDRFFPVSVLKENFKIKKGKKGSDSLLFIEYIRK